MGSIPHSGLTAPNRDLCRSQSRSGAIQGARTPFNRCFPSGAVLLKVSEMIVSNRFVRTYLFGSKVARIHNKSFECCVSTAKEGRFQKQSTIVLEPKIGNTVGAGPAGLRPCGKVIYSPALRKGDRLQFHDVIAKTLDAFGEEGCSLETALEQVFADFKRRGIAAETLNLAADQGQAAAQFNSSKKNESALSKLSTKVSEKSLLCAESLKPDLERKFGKDSEEFRSKYRLVLFEFMCLFLHLTDRFAFAQLGHEKRVKLIDVLVRPSIDTTIETYVGHWPQNVKDGIGRECYNNFSNAQLDMAVVKNYC